jgi:hypothetical protein
MDLLEQAKRSSLHDTLDRIKHLHEKVDEKACTEGVDDEIENGHQEKDDDRDKRGEEKTDTGHDAKLKYQSYGFSPIMYHLLLFFKRFRQRTHVSRTGRLAS